MDQQRERALPGASGGPQCAQGQACGMFGSLNKLWFSALSELLGEVGSRVGKRDSSGL